MMSSRHRVLQNGRSPACRLLWIIWRLVRLPVLAALVVFEPAASVILSAVGFLGIALALILKFSRDLPEFPFWGMMALSIGAVLVLMIYRALIRIFSR